MYLFLYGPGGWFCIFSIYRNRQARIQDIDRGGGNKSVFGKSVQVLWIRRSEKFSATSPPPEKIDESQSNFLDDFYVLVFETCF